MYPFCFGRFVFPSFSSKKTGAKISADSIAMARIGSTVFKEVQPQQSLCPVIPQNFYLCLQSSECPWCIAP